MFKKIVLTSGIAAMIASTAYAEPKFYFRYVSGGGGAGLVSSKPVEPEPETPETPFDPLLVSIQEFEADYIPVNNSTGEAAPGDFVSVNFIIKNDNETALDSANVRVLGSGSASTMPICGQTPLPAHTSRPCGASVYLTREIIDKYAPEKFNILAEIQNGRAGGEDQYSFWNAYVTENVILPQNFDLNKHVRITNKQIVWRDNNSNGVFDIGDYVGVHYYMYNDHPTVGFSYNITKYFGPDQLGGGSSNTITPGGFKADVSLNVVSQSMIDKMAKGQNSRNGGVFISTPYGNINFTSDNQIDFIVQ